MTAYRADVRLHSRLRTHAEALTRRFFQGIERLKRHPNKWARRGAGGVLILGGFLWFLPVLGLWMLPLGLVILSDEADWLRRPRRRLTVWLVSRYRRWRAA